MSDVSLKLKEMMDMYSAGKSDIQVMKALRITKAMFNDYYKKHEPFRRVVDQGRVDSESWWVEQGQLALHSEARFNSTVWQLNMKNRFGWAEKTDSTTNVDPAQKSTEELERELKDYMQAKQPAAH